MRTNYTAGMEEMPQETALLRISDAQTDHSPSKDDLRYMIGYLLGIKAPITRDFSFFLSPVKAHWIKVSADRIVTTAYKCKCSQCGETIKVTGKFRYCPFCNTPIEEEP